MRRPEPGLERCHVLAVALLVPLSAADLAVTLWALDGGASEGNPLAAAMLASPILAWAVKILVPATALVLTLVGREHTPRLVSFAWAIVGFYAAVVLSNALHAVNA